MSKRMYAVASPYDVGEWRVITVHRTIGAARKSRDARLSRHAQTHSGYGFASTSTDETVISVPAGSKRGAIVRKRPKKARAALRNSRPTDDRTDRDKQRLRGWIGAADYGEGAVARAGGDGDDTVVLYWRGVGKWEVGWFNDYGSLITSKTFTTRADAHHSMLYDDPYELRSRSTLRNGARLTSGPIVHGTRPLGARLAKYAGPRHRSIETAARNFEAGEATSLPVAKAALVQLLEVIQENARLYHDPRDAAYGRATYNMLEKAIKKSGRSK